MSRLRRRHRRYALPSDVRSTDEERQLVLFALGLTLAAAALCLARVALASLGVPLAVLLVASQP